MLIHCICIYLISLSILQFQDSDYCMCVINSITN